MGESGEILHVDVEQSEAVTVIVVEGEVDIASAEQLSRSSEELAARPGPVVLDLERVTFMDSSGLRALLELSQAVSDAGRPLALLRPSSAVTRLLDLVDLRQRFVEIADTDAGSLTGLSPA